MSIGEAANGGELRKLLAGYGDNVPVFVSSDPEGNKFRRAEGALTFTWVREDEYDGEIELVDDMDRDEFNADELQRGIVIWPL